MNINLIKKKLLQRIRTKYIYEITAGVGARTYRKAKYKLLYEKEDLAKKRRIIYLDGGLGDVMLLVPYLKDFKKKSPKIRLVVEYQDSKSKDEADSFSVNSTRKLSDKKGNRINPIAEYLSKMDFLDEVRGVEFKNIKGDYWYPPDLHEKVRPLYKPSEYRQILWKLFDKKTVKKAENFYDINKMNNKFVVALHFRRNADIIYKLYKRIKSSEIMRDVVFVSMGSKEHEIIPKDIEEKTISIIDSYKKRLSLIDVLAIGSKVNLYIGGRGSFELFHLLARVPSITFFDKNGLDQIRKNLWVKEMWEENQINGLVDDRKIDLEKIYEEMIMPIYKKWKKLH